MRRIYYWWMVIGIAFFAASCQIDEIPVFGEEHEVYFEKFWRDAISPGTEQADSTEVSFFFESVDSEHVFAELVVCLSGRPLTSELHFGLKVVEDLTTALPSEYELEEKYVFHPNTYQDGDMEIKDTIQVKMKRSDRLAEFKQGIRLVVELVPSAEMGVGQYERCRAVIILTEEAVRPEWWDKEVEAWLLGTYSSTKYKLFLEHVKDATKLDGDLIKNSPDQAIKLVREFKSWLIANPGQEDEYGEISVPL